MDSLPMEIVYLKKSLPRENWIISFKEWKLSAGPQHFTVTWAVITMTVFPWTKVSTCVEQYSTVQYSVSWDQSQISPLSLSFTV